jgi:tight adherence protein B
MSPLLVYTFYGALIGLGLIAASLCSDMLRRMLRRRTAIQRMQSALAGPNEPVSLQRARAQERGGPLGALINAATDLYLQSGGRVKPPLLIASAIGACAVGYIISQRALANPGFSLLIGACLGLAAPYLLLAQARDKRRAAFVAHLPAALDVIVRSLRAGHPLTVAISLVGRDVPGPVGEEFSFCSHELSFGLDIETAIANIAKRVGAAEANVLAAAVSIQQRTGGNLTDVLARLATLLRDRAKLRAKARALSSEGRWSGIFLSVLPFLMFGALSITSPSYYGGVQANPIVIPVLGMTLVWMTIGMFIINRMVNFKP